MRLENSSESAKLEQANALKKCSEDGDRALVESAEQFKTKLIVEYQKYETLSEKYKVRGLNIYVPGFSIPLFREIVHLLIRGLRFAVAQREIRADLGTCSD